MIQERKKRSSSRTNLIISFVFHGVLIAAITYFAAREGLLGKKMKQLAVTMVKEKKVEPPKPKEEEPKPEPPKTAEAPKANVPPPKAMAAAPPPTDTTPAVAPAAAVLPDIQFSDGAHNVEAISDPNGIYKALVEHTLRTRWNRPEDMADDNFVAEAEITIDSKGNVQGYRWLKGSGDARWDGSVKAVLNQTKTISREPPKSFPGKFVVRFDVESQRTETIQLSSR